MRMYLCPTVYADMHPLICMRKHGTAHLSAVKQKFAAEAAACIAVLDGMFGAHAAVVTVNRGLKCACLFFCFAWEAIGSFVREEQLTCFQHNSSDKS